MLFTFIAASDQVAAKGWRGIVPLHSTRTDVVNRFSECEDGGRCFFTLDNEEVLIVFSGEWQKGINECAKQLASDTVLLVQVTLKKPIRVKEAKIDNSRYKRFDPSTPRNMGYLGYIDNSSGLVIQSYKGMVTQMSYIAAQKDRVLCPSYYESPRGFASVFIELCCPSLNLSCPDSHPQAGEQLTLSASTSAQHSSFHWTITIGKILSGQGTSSIVVDTSGLEGLTLIATVELRIDNEIHTMNQSCTVKIQPKRSN